MDIQIENESETSIFMVSDYQTLNAKYPQK